MSQFGIGMAVLGIVIILLEIIVGLPQEMKLLGKILLVLGIIATIIELGILYSEHQAKKDN